MNKIIILGIDQGLASCGLGVLQFKRDKKGKIKFDKILYSELLKTKSKELASKRLLYLYETINQVIIDYKPDYIGCERLFFSPSKKTSNNRSSSIIPTNMTTGIVYLLAGVHDVTLYDFVPGHIKKITTGNGRATKDEVIDSISILLKIDRELIKNEHKADALSIAYTLYKFLENLENEKEEDKKEEQKEQKEQTKKSINKKNINKKEQKKKNDKKGE